MAEPSRRFGTLPADQSAADDADVKRRQIAAR
jgi:hypothetical protein